MCILALLVRKRDYVMNYESMMWHSICIFLVLCFFEKFLSNGVFSNFKEAMEF